MVGSSKWRSALSRASWRCAVPDSSISGSIKPVTWLISYKTPIRPAVGSQPNASENNIISNNAHQNTGIEYPATATAEINLLSVPSGLMAAIIPMGIPIKNEISSA